jgi:hypothetical protein
VFSKDIEENCEILRELIAALPPSERPYAKKAAMKMEKAFTDLQRDYPKSAAVALGAAFAIYMIGARIVEQAKESDGEGLIKLVS